MSAYGYDPSRFINDYSWVGKIGDALSRTALAMPELMEYNKQLHTNNQFKQLNYSAVSNMFNKMESDKLTRLATSMGIDYQNEDEARQKMVEMIPQYDDKTSNADYAKLLADNLIVPIFSKATSDSFPGGKMSPSDFLEFGWSSEIENSLKGTDTYAQHEDQRQYQTQLERKTSEEEAQFNKDRQRGRDDAPIVQSVINGGYTADAAYGEILEKTGDEALAKEVHGIIRSREMDKLNKDYKDAQTRYKRLSNQKTLKTYDFGRLTNELRQVRAEQHRYNKDMENFDKGSEAYTNAEVLLMQAQVAEREIQAALKYLAKNPQATDEDVNAARAIGAANINPEDEQQFIRDFMNGEYEESGIGKLWPGNWGKKDDLKRLQEEYKKRFRKDLQYEKTDDGYRIIPRYGEPINIDSAVSKPSISGGLTDKKVKAQAARDKLMQVMQKEPNHPKIEEIKKKIKELDNFLKG